MTMAKETIEKQFDAVVFMRQQRDKLKEKLCQKAKAEMIDYVKGHTGASTLLTTA